MLARPLDASPHEPLWDASCASRICTSLRAKVTTLAEPVQRIAVAFEISTECARSVTTSVACVRMYYSIAGALNSFLKALYGVAVFV